MNIFLHIGRARTGSTAFQYGMVEARDQLAQSGICYPATRKSDPRHMPLFWSMIADRMCELDPWHGEQFDGLPLRARVAATIEEAQAAGTLVISNEWFSLGFEDGFCAALVEELSRHGKVTAVVVLRDQGDVMVSAWCRQIMDQAAAGPLERMTARRADWGKAVRPLDHFSLVSNWAQVCDVALIRYSRNAARDVAHICGVPDEVDFSSGSESIPLELADYLRVRAAGKPPLARWNALLQMVNTQPDLFAGYLRPEIHEMASELKARVRAAYARSNARLEQEFGHLFVN